MMEELTKTSRILSVYHLFLNCQEVSFQELKQQFEVSEKTSLRDIRLLERAGVLETRYDRNAKAFYPVSLEVRPMAAEENQTRRKYLERIRRLCLLMVRMAEEDDSDGMNKRELYRELFRTAPTAPASGIFRSWRSWATAPHTAGSGWMSRGGGPTRSPALMGWRRCQE